MAQAVWVFSILYLVANSSYAQVFSHQDQGKHFEAEVTQVTLLVKERNDGVSIINSDLFCPLGSAVRANVLPASASSPKLCFVFSKERCAYTRVQNGKAIQKEALARGGRSFMCIELATVQDAERLAALVNAGPQRAQHAFVRPPTPAAKTNPMMTGPAPSQEAKPTPTLAERTQQGSSPPPTSTTKIKPAAVTPAPSESVVQTPPASERTQQASTAPSSLKANAAVATPAPSLAKRQTTVSSRSHNATAVPVKAESRSNAELSTFEQQETNEGSGRWIVSRFMIKAWGNERLTENTYATASIVDEGGAGRVGGDHVYIRNESTKYPLYYGLRKAPDEKLEPGQEVTVAVESYKSGANASITRQLITLKWFDETATKRKRRIN